MGEPGLLDLPGYEVLDVLGQGGFGVVYRARQLAVGREVAVKVDNRPLLAERDRRRFMREVTAAGSVSGHPHVADVYDAGTLADGRPYMVLELCPGGSLADRLRQEGRLPAAEVRDIGVKIADALAAAHAQGVLHRDVKPGNILINRFGMVALSDFGLAAMPAPGREMSVTLESLTPAFAPPEAFELGEPTEAGDVYSLAATLYALLNGRPPRFPEGGVVNISVILALHRLPIPDIDGVPPELTAVLRLGMATNVRERLPSAAALRDALAVVPLTGHPPAGPGPSADPAAASQHGPGSGPGGLGPAPYPPHDPLHNPLHDPPHDPRMASASGHPGSGRGSAPYPPPGPSAGPASGPPGSQGVGPHAVAPPPGPHPVPHGYAPGPSGRRGPGGPPGGPPPGAPVAGRPDLYATHPPYRNGPGGRDLHLQETGPAAKRAVTHATLPPLPEKGGNAKIFVAIAVVFAVLLAVGVGLTLGEHRQPTGTTTGQPRLNPATTDGGTPPATTPVEQVRTTTDSCPAAKVAGANAACVAEPECWGGILSVFGSVTVNRAACDDRHVWETFAIAPLPIDGTTWNANELERHPMVKRLCTRQVLLASRVGRARQVPAEKWHLALVPPSQEAFGRGVRTFRCLGAILGEDSPGTLFRPTG
ncbi:serine/threonine-protein kinase [Thermopolyspora sp. NPDC052614]|uniref:serine/threonine-protein kinase n=1 Tax=Thermopolyspora sp. NPDC052614 TaxID=3155682 RepID=UPI00343E4CFC